ERSVSLALLYPSVWNPGLQLRNEAVTRFEMLMKTALRVLIVDDQRRTRQSLQALLATKFCQIETHEAMNGIEAVNAAEEWLPDIVLMDARMPELDGIEATRLIKKRLPHLKVIVLSMYAEYEAAALMAGADAFVTKGEPPEQLLAVLAAAGSTAGSRCNDENP